MFKSCPLYVTAKNQKCNKKYQKTINRSEPTLFLKLGRAVGTLANSGIGNVLKIQHAYCRCTEILAFETISRVKVLHEKAPNLLCPKS